ncbi:MAG: TetR/AcrR family transcriptional regulator [Tunicatimonas sp.]
MPRTKAFDTDEALDRALRIFWRKGYEGTSMQDLVDGMQINRASLYDTFGNKEALYLEALQRYQQQNQAQVRQLLARHTSVREALDELLETMIQDSLNDPERKGCLVVNATTGLANRYEEVNRLVCDNEQQVAETFAGLIKQGQERGEIGANRDARTLSSYLFASLQGLRVLAVTNSDATLLRQVKKTILSALFI